MEAYYHNLKKNDKTEKRITSLTTQCIENHVVDGHKVKCVCFPTPKRIPRLPQAFERVTKI